MIPRLFILLSATTSLALTAPAAIAQNRDSTRNMVENYAEGGAVDLGQVVKVSIAEGLLVAEAGGDMPMQATPVRFKVNGSDATWVARNRNVGGSPYVSLTRYDFDAEGEEYWSILITLRSNYFSVYAQTGDAASGIRVRLTQSARSIRFNLTSAENGVQKTILSASADSLHQLQTEHPAEVRKYLGPALKLITGHSMFRPGATDVYRIFAEIMPGPNAAAAFEQILKGLDADSFQAREQASKQLTESGPTGVLAALRRDQADLSAEARSRIDLFLSANSNLSIDDAAAARRNPNVLIDCLGDNDPAVRAAAKAALEAVAGQKLDFDPAEEDPEDRAQQIAAVSKLVLKLNAPTTRSTTRPATP